MTVNKLDLKCSRVQGISIKDKMGVKVPKTEKRRREKKVQCEPKKRKKVENKGDLSSIWLGQVCSSREYCSI